MTRPPPRRCFAASSPAGARSTPPGCMRAARRKDYRRRARAAASAARRCDRDQSKPGGRGGGRRDRWAERGAAVAQLDASLVRYARRARRHLLPALARQRTVLDETPEAVQPRTRRAASGGSASNYSAGEVELIAERMAGRGWVRPTVYQGVYNALTRGVEAELMPLLRELGIAFYAYNPLAGGLLTGKHHARASAAGSGGRFDGNGFYQDRYWRRELFAALDGVRRACAGTTSAAARRCPWRRSDPLVGPSLDAALRRRPDPRRLVRRAARRESRLCRAGPLPAPVVDAWEAAWASRRRRRAMTAMVSRVPSSAAGLPPPPRPPPRPPPPRRRTHVGHRRGCRRQRCRGLGRGGGPPPPSGGRRRVAQRRRSARAGFQRRPTVRAACRLAV